MQTNLDLSGRSVDNAGISDGGERCEERVSIDGGTSGSVEAIRRGVPVSQFGEFVYQHHAQGNKKFIDKFEVLYVAIVTHLYAVRQFFLLRLLTRVNMVTL